MTVDELIDVLYMYEPDFRYRGETYSISWKDGMLPNAELYVTASDCPEDSDLDFSCLDDLLDHWMIQGKTFREILPEIEI